MRIAVTGTPGTGKTTATDLIDADLEVVHLNDLVRTEGLTRGRDADRDTLIVDLDALAARVAGMEDVVFESHLAHRLDVGRVIVLRCHPDELRRRLRARGEPEGTIRENVESEALDIVLAEAVEQHGTGSVYEVDTTDHDSAAVARELDAIIAGDRSPRIGTVSFLDTL